MIADINAEVRYTRELIGKKTLSADVMKAMEEVPRKEFVPENMQRVAYSNGPLPIGYGQTISQPYIVALMTDLLLPTEDSVILEVGTGSGYQAAILSRLVKQVYSIEIIKELADKAKERLWHLNYHNIEIKVGDGYYGWKEHAPYDGIIVTAASNEIPQPLIEQLKPNAKLVIPIGQPFMYQDLLLIEKKASGEISEKNVLGVSFVPLTGNHSFPSQS